MSLIRSFTSLRTRHSKSPRTSPLWSYSQNHSRLTRRRSSLETKSRPARPTRGSVQAKTAAGDVIRREVTVFSNVGHGPGLSSLAGIIGTAAAACQYSSSAITPPPTLIAQARGLISPSMASGRSTSMPNWSPIWKKLSGSASGGNDEPRPSHSTAPRRASSNR